QDLSETDMRAWFAAVVVGVDEVDAETPQTLHRFARRLVGRRSGADLGIVQRHSGEKKASTVEVEIAAVDPELAKADAHGVERIGNEVRLLLERDLDVERVLRGVKVPEFVRLPGVSDGR